MRLKSLSLFVLLCSSLLALTSCGDNEHETASNQEYPQELISLARMEALNLAPTLNILDQVIINYQSWERGEINREQLAEQLAPLYPEVNKMQEDYLQFRKDTGFAQTPAVNHEAYQTGLYQGEMIRKRIINFIASASLGYPAAENILANKSAQKFDDPSLKRDFQSYISSNIEKRVSELESVLSEFKTKGLLE